MVCRVRGLVVQGNAPGIVVPPFSKVGRWVITIKDTTALPSASLWVLYQARYD